MQLDRKQKKRLQKVKLTEKDLETEEFGEFDRLHF